MAKLRLGIVNSSSFLTSYGGVGPFIKNLDPYLQQEYEVEYIKLPERIQKIQFIPRRLLFLVYLLTKKRYIKSFDVILSHEPEGSYVVTKTKVPLVNVFHGNYNAMSQSRFWYGKYFKWLFSHFDEIIKKKAILLYSVGNERPGINKLFNPIYHSVQIKDTKKRKGFIYPGRLEKIKNIDRIITAYSMLPESIQAEHPLYIAGFGSQESMLRALVKKLNLEERVIFMGNLTNDQIIEVDSTKAILLMASSQEGMPMAIAEALSVGVPVIATATGDIPRILKSNENGFLLPIEFEYDEYIRSIQTILSDFDRFSANAVTSSEIFNAEKVAKSLANDINNALSKQ